DGLDLLQVAADLAAGLVDVLQRRAGQFELPCRLQRHRGATAQQRDGAPVLVDPVPAEARQRLQQRLDAALAVELRRAQVIEAESELLVLGADAPVVLRLLAGSDVPDQLVAAGDGRVAGMAGTGHAHRSRGGRRSAPGMRAPWRHYKRPGPGPASPPVGWSGPIVHGIRAQAQTRTRSHSRRHDRCAAFSLRQFLCTSKEGWLAPSWRESS